MSDRDKGIEDAMNHSRPKWHERAACRGVPFSVFFPPSEDPKDLEFVRTAYCDRCPVRTDCLQSALVHGDKGFWAGTATAERDKLMRIRHRRTCPLCRNVKLIRIPADLDADDLSEAEPHSEVCLACGASWAIPDRPPKPHSSGLIVEQADRRSGVPS